MFVYEGSDPLHLTRYNQLHFSAQLQHRYSHLGAFHIMKRLAFVCQEFHLNKLLCLSYVNTIFVDEQLSIETIEDFFRLFKLKSLKLWSDSKKKITWVQNWTL